MNLPPNHNWKPDPQLLAAYFDGELDGRDDLTDLRNRIETWLEAHPETLMDGEESQRLRKLCMDTAPAEPSSDAWNKTLARIEAGCRRRVATRPASRRPWLIAGSLAVGVVLFVGLLFGGLRLWQRPTAIENPIVPVAQEKPKSLAVDSMEELPVATADEVLILRVEGRDTGTIVVGELPLHGSLELADPAEILVVHVQPDQHDRMVPRVRQWPDRPLVWAFLATERD